MSWKDAILKILQQNKEGNKYIPMHYREITDAIFENGLISPEGKKTPANTAYAALLGYPDLFESLGGGEFKLTVQGEKQFLGGNSKQDSKERPEVKEENGLDDSHPNARLIKTYGMYWKRDCINWQNNPKLLGVQSFGAKAIDFSEMRGIYMLYDGREVIYVGQATDSILKRLVQHTKNRLATRWDRFSWFSIDGVGKNGELVKVDDKILTDVNALVDAMEGILIEGLEPRQNRRQGDNFGFEYYQVIDKEIEKEKFLAYLKNL